MVGVAKKNILLVEDEVLIAMSEQMQLEDAGYRVHHVASGEKAVNVVLGSLFPVDLILMDINLGPGIDGTEAATQILQYKDIPVVFLSSHVEPEVVNRTEKITSYGYVVKTSGIVVLDASIKMAFKLYESKFKVRAIQNHYEAIIESTSDLIWSVNPDDFGLMTYNSGLYNYFLKNRSITISRGMRPIDLFPSETYVKIWEDFYRKALAMGTYTTEYSTYSGTHTILLTISSIKIDDKIVGISVFGKDITELVRLQQVALESEFRYKVVFESAPIAIIITRGTEIIYANPAYLNMYGYDTLEDMNTLDPLSLFAPEWRPKILENIRKRAEGLPVPGSYEAECLRRDGTVFPVLMYFARTELSHEPVTIGFIIDRTNFRAAVNYDRFHEHGGAADVR